MLGVSHEGRLDQGMRKDGCRRKDNRYNVCVKYERTVGMQRYAQVVLLDESKESIKGK